MARTLRPISRLLSRLLFDVALADPLTYSEVAALVVLTALISCYAPALRALRVNPVVAPHEE